MIIKEEKIVAIKKFLIDRADEIQKRATEQHKELLGGEKFRSEIIKKYQDNHIEVVKQLAEHLESIHVKASSKVFKQLGETIGEDSIKDNLTIEEAIDGIIFLKQAMWEKLNKEGLFQQLNSQELYNLTYTTGSYTDIVVSKIAFTFHSFYSQRKEQQEKQKNEFIGMASHELKTPVTSVKAFAQVLQNRFAKSGDEESAMLLRKMDGQLDKLNALIGDLLDVTKIETGKLQFNEDFFDFNEFIN